MLRASDGAGWFATAPFWYRRINPTTVEINGFSHASLRTPRGHHRSGNHHPHRDRPGGLLVLALRGTGRVRRINAFAVGDLPNDVGGEIAEFDSKSWFKSFALPEHRKTLSKSQKYMARDIQLAVAAAELAIVDAGLADGGVEPTRIGVDLGAGLISSELDELAPAINLASEATGTFDYQAWGREGIRQIEPIWLLKYLPNMLACHISILLDCQGPSNTITEAEAVLEPGHRRGRADHRARPRRRDDHRRRRLEDPPAQPGPDEPARPDVALAGRPERACRPFDRRRDGWVPGEGAGILILEEREHALSRGARIYGEILGFGSGCDANPGGGLDPEGVGTEIALTAALRDAGLEPGRDRPRQRPRRRRRSSPTWPRRGRSNASSGPGGRSPSRR